MSASSSQVGIPAFLTSRKPQNPMPIATKSKDSKDSQVPVSEADPVPVPTLFLTRFRNDGGGWENVSRTLAQRRGFEKCLENAV